MCVGEALDSNLLLQRKEGRGEIERDKEREKQTDRL